MRRLLSFFLLICLLLGCFSACDLSGNNPKDTETETESESVSETETEQDEHVEHTYENGKCSVCGDQLAYELKFTSNGDGTCYVSEIITYPEYDAEFTLVIPEKSPAGDTVTELRCEALAYCIPLMLLEEDLDEICDEVRKEHSYYADYVDQRFLYMTLEGISDAAKEQMLQLYPLTELTGFMKFDSSLLEPAYPEGLLTCLKYMYEYGGYSAMDLKEDYENLRKLVEESNAKNKEEILATLPTLPTNLGESIVAVKLPDSIQWVDMSIFAACTNLKNVEGSLAYELKFTSNGDGTCYVSEIITYPEYDAEFTLVIPEKSPSGDTVTELRCEAFAYCLPTMLLAEDLSEICDEVRKEHSYYADYVDQRFLYMTLEGISDAAKEQMLQLYPLTELTGFMKFDSSLLEPAYPEGLLTCLKYMYEYGGYSAMDLKEDYENLRKLVEESNAENKEEILATLPTLPTNLGESIVAVELPDTIESVDESIFAACINLARE